MKTITKSGLASLLVMALLFSCKRSEAAREEIPVTEESSAPSREKDVVSSSAPVWQLPQDLKRLEDLTQVQRRREHLATFHYSYPHATLKAAQALNSVMAMRMQMVSMRKIQSKAGLELIVSSHRPCFSAYWMALQTFHRAHV